MELLVEMDSRATSQGKVGISPRATQLTIRRTIHPSKTRYTHDVPTESERSGKLRSRIGRLQNLKSEIRDLSWTSHAGQYDLRFRISDLRFWTLSNFEMSPGP